MTDCSETSAFGEEPKTNLGQTFLNNYPFQEAETDWVVGGRLNKDFIERYLQDLLGEYDREFYNGIGERPSRNRPRSASRRVRIAAGRSQPMKPCAAAVRLPAFRWRVSEALAMPPVL